MEPWLGQVRVCRRAGASNSPGTSRKEPRPRSAGYSKPVTFGIADFG